jgi:Glycerate kinase family
LLQRLNIFTPLPQQGYLSDPTGNRPSCRYSEFYIPPYFIDDRQWMMGNNVRFDVICDVTNPLLGEKGAAHIYVLQKGANDEDIKTLETDAKNFWKVSNKS